MPIVLRYANAISAILTIRWMLTHCKLIQGILHALTDVVNHVIRGDIPQYVRPIFFGANLTPLQKKGGGIHPIAVGAHRTWLQVLHIFTTPHTPEPMYVFKCAWVTVSHL